MDGLSALRRSQFVSNTSTRPLRGCAYSNDATPGPPPPWCNKPPGRIIQPRPICIEELTIGTNRAVGCIIRAADSFERMRTPTGDTPPLISVLANVTVSVAEVICVDPAGA